MRKWGALITLALTMFVIDMTIMNVSIPLVGP
jgi:hypothetical protein